MVPQENKDGATVGIISHTLRPSKSSQLTAVHYYIFFSYDWKNL